MATAVHPQLPARGTGTKEIQSPSVLARFITPLLDAHCRHSAQGPVGAWLSPPGDFWAAHSLQAPPQARGASALKPKLSAWPKTRQMTTRMARSSFNRINMPRNGGKIQRGLPPLAR